MIDKLRQNKNIQLKQGFQIQLSKRYVVLVHIVFL